MPVVSVTDTPQNQQFGPIPPGNYYGDVEKAVYRDSKSGNKMVALTFAVANNRKLFVNHSVEHPNPEVSGRALRDVADLIFACGIDALDSWDEVSKLEGKKIMVRVYTHKNKERGEEESVIGSYAKYTGEHRNKTVMKLGVVPAKPSGAKVKGEEDAIPF